MSNCDWHVVGTVALAHRSTERTSTHPIYQTTMASMRFALIIVAVLAVLLAMASAQDTIVVNPPPANPSPNPPGPAGPPGPPGPPSGPDTIVVNPPPANPQPGPPGPPGSPGGPDTVVVNPPPANPQPGPAGPPGPPGGPDTIVVVPPGGTPSPGDVNVNVQNDNPASTVAAGLAAMAAAAILLFN
jgi:hypothetical protein